LIKFLRNFDDELVYFKVFSKEPKIELDDWTFAVAFFNQALA